LSLKLLLDEDSQAKYLANLLRVASHDVLTVNEAELGGLPDVAVLNYARQQRRVVLTRNCEDFINLHQIGTVHAGILAVYQSYEQSKNMSYQAITRAIANLEEVGCLLENQFIILNQWNWNS
jgi:predicted nuclease of predicted toxin-antitoxin system